MTATHDEFREAELLMADSVGEVIEHWGFRKALGRLWTVLYLAGEPLPAVELAERLSMSSGAVSMALNELQEWGVVSRVWKPGERREFFSAETDLWKMICKVVSERERFWVRSVHERIQRATAILKRLNTKEARAAAHRAKVLQAIAQTAETVIETFIVSRRADFSGFASLIQFPSAQSGERRS
jgi:DNA-binding transcriptional regulator GbsR (MarR family)